MSDQQEYKKLKLKRDIYQIIAVFFFVAGLALFVVLYTNYYAGNLFKALTSPRFLIVLTVPFLPALVLSFFIRSLEKKMRAILKGQHKP